MAETKTWIKQHAVVVYFIMTLLISWTGLLILLGPEGFIGKTEASGAQVPLMFLAMYAGPVIAGLLMTVLTSGRPGLLRMLSGFIRWRVGIVWYGIAMLTAPALTLGTHLILSIYSPAFLPSPGYLAAATSRGMGLLLLAIALASGILTGFFEEFGWTGFATPKLRSSFGILQTGVIVGLVWGLWHLPLFTAKDPSGTVPLALLVLVRLFTHLPPFRVLMVWVLERTRSPFMVMLTHASFTASALLIQPRSATAIHAVTVTLVLSAILWLVVAVVTGMGKRRRLVHVSIPAMLLLCMLTPAILQADALTGKENTDVSYDTIDAYLDKRLKELHIPGASMAIVEDGKVAHYYSYGQARPGGAPPTQETPFILGSLTKSFTALAVMQLAEAGRIDVDAPVQTFVPWFKVADPEASAQMTVRQLLNQTSGLSMFTGMMNLVNFDPSPDACDKRIRELSSYAPTRGPGEAFEYSDMNYNLLGLVIEAASGEPYGTYIEKHIFSPLEMSHSHANYPDARTDNMAVGHTLCFGWARPVPELQRPMGSTPSGQLISSAGDMARYMTALLQGGTLDGASILSSGGIAELSHPSVRAGSMGVDMGYYGMGWFIDDEQGPLRIWHDGMVPDFFSYLVLLPEQNRGCILLVNANHMIVSYSLLDICEAVTDLLTGQRVETGDQGGIYWILRSFLLILVLQFLGIIFTLRRIRRWRIDARRRPKKIILWGFHILLAPLPHVALLISAVILLCTGMTRFMLLFMPDLTGLLLLCACLSFIWLGLRTYLILRAAKTP